MSYMADPGFMNGVSEVVGVSQPTVSRAVKEVVEKNLCKISSLDTLSSQSKRSRGTGNVLAYQKEATRMLWCCRWDIDKSTGTACYSIQCKGFFLG